MSGDLLEAALGYAGRGWSVFPVARDKRPCTAHGLKDATTDPDQIREWWAMFATAGVAIRTGEGLLVLDVDGEDGEESLHQLERQHGELPETVRSVTGSGGAHYYFRGSARNSVGKLGAGLDIRAEGGYVVAPPSPHLNGHRYEWDLAPDEAELAPLLDGWWRAKPNAGTAPPPRLPRRSRTISATPRSPAWPGRCAAAGWMSRRSWPR